MLFLPARALIGMMYHASSCIRYATTKSVWRALYARPSERLVETAHPLPFEPRREAGFEPRFELRLGLTTRCVHDFTWTRYDRRLPLQS